MKNKLLGGWIFTAAVAAACLAGEVARAQPQPPDTTVALPADIEPGTPLAQVVKLVQVGVNADVVKTYIANSVSTFDLTAEKIIELTDLGVPPELVNAMMDHDKNLAPAVPTAPPPAPLPVPAVADNSGTAAPDAPVDVNYFNDTLSPYGSWVVVEGYGRVWRPTTVIYDPNWQPYCDRGHWVYSDCGWYWDSDYSWGVTFHYGRWFRHDRFGWCWWPDTTWAPSWVTWRQSDAYCGWAPLPPFTVYRPGAGFFYRGANVAVGFDFGLPATCFTFVPVANFCDRHPRSFRADPQRGGQIFRQTTIINNFNVNRSTIINGGISVDRINAVTHRPIVPVDVGALRNAERQGWRGPVTAADRAVRNSSGAQFRNGPATRDNRNNGNNGANASHPQNFGQPNQPPNRNGNINSPARPQTAPTPGGANGPRDRDLNNRTAGSSASAPQNFAPQINTRPAAGSPPPITPANRMPAQNSAPAIDKHPVPGTPFVRSQPAQVIPPAAPVRPAAQENLRPNRNYNDAPVVAPPRSIPQIQQRPAATPAAPRNVPPPPAQNQPHNGGQNSGGANRDKPNG